MVTALCLERLRIVIPGEVQTPGSLSMHLDIAGIQHAVEENFPKAWNVSLSVFVSSSVSLSVFACVHVYVSVYLYLCVCMRAFVCVCVRE